MELVKKKQKTKNKQRVNCVSRSPVLHHPVFILTGGGRVDDEAKGGRNRHSRGLVATSFMRRSGAVNPSVIEFIWVNTFTTHCLVDLVR